MAILYAHIVWGGFEGRVVDALMELKLNDMELGVILLL